MACSTNCCSNLTSGFIDLATYDELEKGMYGGGKATAYFVREHTKATWFTVVPTCLQICSGQAQFNQSFSAQISRAGDYLLNAWVQVDLPTVTLSSPAGTSWYSWSPNLMHNLVEETCISFNDLVAERFLSFFLDFWAMYTIPAGKKTVYANMIGNTADLTDACGSGVNGQPGTCTIPGKCLALPLPYFFARDSGVALPTAALPYNQMLLQFKFRHWDQLMTRWTVNNGNTSCQTVTAAEHYNGTEPQLSNVQVWAHYSIVSNDERRRMACSARDILMEQVQHAPANMVQTTAGINNQNIDIRFSHAVKVLFFGIKNTSCTGSNGGYHSNYGATSPVITAPLNANGALSFNDPNNAAYNDAGGNPLATASLLYENTCRLGHMSASCYYSGIQPYYYANSAPIGVLGASPDGYNMYSYSLDFHNVDPLGSTNYGKLTNVTLANAFSPGYQTTKSSVVAPMSAAQTGEITVAAVNNNFVRISGGALGFPVV